MLKTHVAPIVGSILSVEKLLDEAICPPIAFSAQGLTVVDDGTKRLLSTFSVIEEDERCGVVKSQALRWWKQAWCEYHETVRGRGRPPVRAAYYITGQIPVPAAGGNGFSNEEMHRLLLLLFTKLDSTRTARIMVFTRRHGPEMFEARIILHPVALDGQMIRLDKDFAGRLQQILSTIFCSGCNPRRFVKIWLS